MTAPRGEVHALHVDGQDAVERLLARVEHRAERADGCVVDQAVDAAEARQRASDHALDVGGAGHIRLEHLDAFGQARGLGRGAHALEALRGARDLRLRESEGQHAVAAPGQLERDGFAEAEGAAGDEGDEGDGPVRHACHFRGRHPAKLAAPVSWRPSRVSQSAPSM